MYTTKDHAGKRPFPKQLKPVQGAAITDNRPQTVLQKKQPGAMEHGSLAGNVLQLKPIKDTKGLKKGSYCQVNSGPNMGEKLYYVRKVNKQDKYEFSDENKKSIFLPGTTDIDKITLIVDGGSKKRKQESNEKKEIIKNLKKEKTEDEKEEIIKDEKEENIKDEEEEIIKDEKKKTIKKKSPGEKYALEFNKMKDDKETEYVSYGANQTGRIIKTFKERNNDLKKNKLQQAHLGTGIIVYPRTYNKERIAQVMRWVSTVLFNALLHKKCSPNEIQAGFFEDKLYIAGNTNKSKTVLEDVLGISENKSLKESLKEIINNKVHKTWKGKFIGERYERHRKKLLGRILGNKTDERYEALETSFNKTPKVAMEKEPEEKKGLHAERRIKKDLGKNFDKTITRGVKRPCTICYLEAYSEAPKETINLYPKRSGPLWYSKSSTIGYNLDKKGDIEKILKKSLHSSASVPKSESKKDSPNVTHDFDSESDSDEE